MINIICFGDSITRGENDEKQGGWVDRLKSFCIKKFLETKDNEICVFNMGIGGETTDGLMKRFVNEFEVRLLENGNNIVTIAYGANDLALVSGKNVVSLERFHSNLNFCIDYALEKNAKVFLINILPILKSMDNQLSTVGKRRRLSDITKYNERILSIAKTKHVGHIDNYSTFKFEQENLFTFDGVHPNSKGHQLIYEKIKNVILKTVYNNV